MGRSGLQPDFRLDGKIALVTGSSRGLGREMAMGFARAGADVVIVSRKLESCESVAAEIIAETGQRALPVACHVGRWSELDGLVDRVYSAFGRVDVLVNNAGMSPLYPKPQDVSEDLFDKVIAVNLKGPFRLSALVGARMAEQGGGSIINISSIASQNPGAAVIPYAAAKAGLNAMTIAYSYALGPSVRVNCIVCGAFRTDITNQWDMPAYERRARETFALGRIGEPREIVGAALYLASDASSYTSGALIDVNGGRG
jgi:NAD(P)-dependent dehydrogenase (short-subunit alcohol dehydrogenase family)